jgi:hypothetical protein
MCDVYAEALQNYLHSSEWRVSYRVALYYAFGVDALLTLCLSLDVANYGSVCGSQLHAVSQSD